MTLRTRSASLWVAAAAGALVLLASPAHAQTSSTGGTSVGAGSAEGASGGGASVVATPTAVSGSSGETRAGSSSTNTGDTGPAYSEAISSPVASSGSSGATGGSGPVSSNPTAVNTAPLGTAIATGGGQAGAASTFGAAAGTGAATDAGSGSSGIEASGLSPADFATVVAASQPVAIPEITDAGGSPINFSRSLPSAPGLSPIMGVAVVIAALFLVAAATMSGTRLGRRLAT